MNSISVIGTGYVGLVTGTCLSEFGMIVTCMDVDQNKIKNLKDGILPIYEPGLQPLVEKNYKSGRLKFTTDINEAVYNSTTIFIAVGTPPREDGSADLQYVLSVAHSIAENMNNYKVIVNKSTVPVGTSRKVKGIIKEILASRNMDIEFDIISNPEFLREGAAVRDFMHPDRVVIGAESEKGRNIIKNIYNVLYLIDTPFVFTGLETAELIKYASNAFLATKISFINEIANLCDAVGGNVADVAKAMGMDGRIGKYFLHAGPGYGGSCFPKDTKALIKIGKDFNVDMGIVKSAEDANEYQKKHMVTKIINKMGELDGKIFCILGLTFKPETDDMREAPSITIINKLIEEGVTVKTYDPIAMDNASQNFFTHIKSLDLRYNNSDNITKSTKLIFCTDEYQAAESADALVIMTEWNQFRNLDIRRIKKAMNGNFYFDLRNIYIRTDIEQYGFIYEGVGR